MQIDFITNLNKFKLSEWSNYKKKDQLRIIKDIAKIYLNCKRSLSNSNTTDNDSYINFINLIDQTLDQLSEDDKEFWKRVVVLNYHWNSYAAKYCQYQKDLNCFLKCFREQLEINLVMGGYHNHNDMFNIVSYVH